MKKLLLSLAAASVMLVACNKDEAVLPTSTSEAATATISIKVYAQTVLNDTDQETAPDGTTVVATATHSGNTYRYEGSISGGNLSFTIPAQNTGTTVSFTFSDFRIDRTNGDATVTKDVIYTAALGAVTVMPGSTEVRDVTYN